jgi:predicted CoA-substrate-specific enzyme activase
MSCYVGIDIGAVSATAAVICDDAFSPAPGTFELYGDVKGVPGKLYISSYRRTRGKPLAAATELLEEIAAGRSSVRTTEVASPANVGQACPTYSAGDGRDAITGIILTGSGAKMAAGKLGATLLNEFKAIATGLWTVGVEAGTIFEMGGETSKYLRLSRNDDGTVGIVDYATNGDCAAGTGSFIDQQAGRLKYAIEDVGEICRGADRAAQVAGRCSVFAKSDMIHAQQKGYNPAEVLRGLCNAVARNFRTAVVRSHAVVAPVAFVGGVAANGAVVRAMKEIFELDDSQLILPRAFAHMPAIGAAVTAARGTAVPAVSSSPRTEHAQSEETHGRDGHATFSISELKAASDTAHGQFPTQDPLCMDRVLLLRNEVTPYNPPGAGKVDVYIGIDIGSVSTNVVAIDEQGRLIKEIYVRTQGRPIQVVADALIEVQREWGQRFNVRGVGTTGSGRELIGELVGADTINDEITAHKTGATFVGHTMLGGRVPDTIFEIGGQDAKFISLQDGVVVDFTMNEACAAGTGSFLEERAEELDISIKGQFAKLALSSKSPIRLGERCTVFMERDVNSYMQRGADKADLVAGLAYSVVYNYINRVVRGRKIGDCIFFQGGTAYNDAVAAAFASVLGKQIIVPPFNGVIGAIGSALLARDKMASNCGLRIADCGLNSKDAALDPRALGSYISELNKHSKNLQSEICDATSEPENPQSAIRNPQLSSRFRGYDMSKVGYSLREFTCKGCSNACSIQEFDVEGEKTYWGDKCSDKFRKRAKSATKPVIDDLFAMRSKLLLDESALPATPQGARTIGIPLTMFAMEQLPLWRTFFAHCGLAVVLSDPTNKKIVQAGLDSVVAEPCFPIIVAHGHIANLAAKGVDYVWLPNIISMETPWMENESHLCPWHQTLPFVIRQAPLLAGIAPKFLSPLVQFRLGKKFVTKEMQKFLATTKLGIPAARIAAAMDKAYQAQDRFRTTLLQAGQDAVDKLIRTSAMGIVIVGRPYNIHDAGVNLSLAAKLREYYGVNCVPIDMLDTSGVDVRDINDSMYWDLGRKILAASRVVGRHDNLHIIYVTNFKCGPDSFVKHFIRPASGKPFLTLQFDGHSNDAGMMTRCEAYLDSKGVLRGQQAKETQAVMAK